ncbi:hypothetical protein L6164_009013 [Bauhinia variegata]|uniref:Uncharacterized protein n=1 Tax=Bauhinia variegata TaxID=167791 RepID=A0ACB9PIK3_BAUVA|nr:hypothetical protein L6164_009013 [Bauhinia variegata]
MDNGERWRTFTCAGGAQDKTIIDKKMLRFRPIAPKPTAGGPLSCGSAFGKNNDVVSRRRTKRKHVRVNRNRNGCSKGKERTCIASEGMGDRSAVTLQLLPENCMEQNHHSSNGGSWWGSLDRTAEANQDQDDCNPFIRLNLMSGRGLVEPRPLDDRTMVFPPRMRASETWVTVEQVRETCMDVRELGCTDLERVMNLDGDTCPGFISDGLNRVVWMNGAFRRMVMEDHSPETEMKVCLVMKEKLEVEKRPYRALTCQAKVQYTWGKDKCLQKVPCDAWRMEGGRYAWRLDVKAALSLGR